MSRGFQILGPSIIRLQFGAAVPLASGSAFALTGTNVWQLGLASDSVMITPNFYYRDVKTDSYGMHVPADVLQYLADCTISFKLIHFDPDPLNFWLRESLAGGGIGVPSSAPAGTMPFAGTPMGGGFPLYASGNHYVGLGIQPFNTFDVSQVPWRFPATYLTGPPVKWPIGDKTSIVECQVRALPYSPLLAPSFINTLEGDIYRDLPTTTIEGEVTTDAQATLLAGQSADPPANVLSLQAVLWDHLPLV